MNTKTLILSTTSSSYNKVMDTVILNDATVLNISLGDVYEDVLPISLQINWGDNNILYYDNDLYKVYRKESIIPEVIYGKFSKILQDTYSFEYYPSKTATYKKMTAQFLIKYTNKDTTLITIPIEIRSADYFESVYDMKMMSTHILPEDGFKTHKFLTSKGNYVVEVESPMSENIIISEDIDISENLNILNGLISFWELDETSGVRDDAHGSINLTPATSVGSAAGKINNAASFNGVSYGGSWLTSGHTYSLATNGFSVSTWLNGTTSSVGPAVSQWDSGVGFIVGVDSDYEGTAVFIFVLGDFPYFTLTYHPYSAGWHHIVGTYDPTIGTSKLYVDGVLRTTVTDIPSISLNGTANFKMGTIDNGFHLGEFVYNGSVDSTGLWTRPLTDAEIVALYNNGSGLPYEQF